MSVLASDTLVLGDDPSAFAPLGGGDRLPYREAVDPRRDEGHVRELRQGRRVLR